MQSLQSNLPELNLGDFRFIEKLGFGITKKKLFYCPDGKAPNYCNLKLMLQEGEKPYSLSRIKELKAAQDVLKLKIGLDGVFTDSLLVWPNRNYHFSRRIREPEITTKGIYPLLLEGTILTEENGRYIVKGGERTEISNFPVKTERITEPIEELGLPRGTQIWVNEDHHYAEGFRNLILTDKTVTAVSSPLIRSHKGYYLCLKGRTPKTLDDYL